MFQRKQESKGRVRFLSDDDRKRLLTACKESPHKHIFPIVVLALSTGARRGELLPLTWKQIDFKRSVITLTETKNNETRTLPLRGFAHDTLLNHSKIRLIDCDYVFPNQSGRKPVDLKSAWDAVIETAEIKDFRFHDLRHSAASYLAMNGATLSEISAILRTSDAWKW